MSEAPVHVRGMLVLQQRARMETMAGGAVVARAVASLGDADRSAYEGANVLSWVPQRAVRDVTRRVAEALGMTPVELAERVVTASVTAMCSGPWNVLLRVASDDALMARAAVLFGRTFDRGTFEARKVDGLVELTLTDWPDAQAMDLASIAAGMRAILHAVGRDADIVRTDRPGGASFRVYPR